MPLSDITRRSVHQAIEEYDKLGGDEFLVKYGFGHAKTTWLVYAGKCYDSKAIIGVAHGYARPDFKPLTPGDFHGGEPVRRKLQKLNFEVTNDPVTVLPREAADDRDFNPNGVQDAREWINRTIAQRRGQKGFRDSLIIAYDGKCAITGCSTLEVLEAAHIFPYKGCETNVPRNGLLLRADIHTLLDCKLLAIDPETKKILVTSSLQDSEYESLVGRRVRKPQSQEYEPSEEALRKHLKECKQAGLFEQAEKPE